MRKLILTLFIILLGEAIFAQSPRGTSRETTPLQTQDSLLQKRWVDSIYNQLSLREKVAQLFVAGLSTNQSQKDVDYIKSLVKNYGIGGVIFMKGKRPTYQAKLTNIFQKEAEVPLIIGQDAEWGLAMRLDSTFAFPWNMTLGAVMDNQLIEKTGKYIAKDAKRIGVNFDFAPDVDVNINPKNPIIGNRSFGQSPQRVAQKGIAFMRGMQSEGVLTTAKHFPGHGDTDMDSHKTLPVLNFSRKRLEEVEFYPYKEIIPAGITGVMITHLSVPVLDDRVDHPSTLSKPIITGVLKKEMGFKGLVVTDALNMKGVANYDEPGKTSLDAFKAGNDILLIPRDVTTGIKKIVAACQSGEISEKRLAHSVKKILIAKYWAGLNQVKPVEISHLKEDLNPLRNKLLYEKLMENAITIIKNDRAILPIRDLSDKKIAYVHLGNSSGDAFYRRLKKYTEVDRIAATDLGNTMKVLEPYDLVIVGLHKSNANPWTSYKITNSDLTKLQEIARNHPTIFSVFTSPYTMLDFKSTANLRGIVVAYQNSEIAQEKAAEVIFGALGAKGKLPVEAGAQFPEGTQYITQPLNRLTYGIPESVGMSSDTLAQIDSIARVAITEKMAPGMQVLVARKGKVIFDKNYGYHTYAKKNPVKSRDVYDLASVTKILATLPLLMELQEKGIIQLDESMGELLPFLKGTNKAGIPLIKALSHVGRFKAWIPFYKKTLDDKGNLSSDYYSDRREGKFKTQVAGGIFLRTDYQDSIYQRIADSDLRKQKGYKYSDLPFYLFKKFLESYYHQSEDKLVQTRFYQSLGANRMGYLPLQRFLPSEIVPAEIDHYYRHQALLGYVDDEGAAMFGGVGGHAGLYSNANDIAKMMQMYLNGGTYGGIRYFKPETINLFNTCTYCNKDVRRGVGFDKPQKRGEPGPASDLTSRNSFGHSGFTGTLVWADPDEDLIFICLSNRTFPDRENRDFIRKDIRTKMQTVVYKSILIPKVQKLLGKH